MADNDVLGRLEPYFDCVLSIDDKDRIIELHERFRKDLLIDKVNLDGVELIVKPYLYNRSLHKKTAFTVMRPTKSFVLRSKTIQN